MIKKILKRKGNYILRVRKYHNDYIHYKWYYSKELHNIIEEYGEIKDWQFDNIEHTLSCWNYCWYKPMIDKINIRFKELLKTTQEKYIIPELLQYANKVGKYANK